MLNKFIRAT